MEINVLPYSPSVRERLLLYMTKVFPHRDWHYLEWWIDSIEKSGETAWEKNVVLTDDGDIVGCTTVVSLPLNIRGKRVPYFIIGNTIVSTDYRGRGLSRHIYGKRNSFTNYMTVGITDIAWKIQPRYVKNFTPIRPISVYVTVNRKLPAQILWKAFGRTGYETFRFPDVVNLHGGLQARRVKSLHELAIPQDGVWTSDDAELIRDESFFRHRYFDIWCSERYGIYSVRSQQNVIGYVVLRPIVYKKMKLVSIVDYRFSSRMDECKVFRIGNAVARANGLGGGTFVVVKRISPAWEAVDN